MTKKPLIIITGPTAVGKTSLSIELAKKLNGEIISADSMQVYCGLDIGTAKISEHEMDGIPHHLIDILQPTESFNVAIFQEKARQAIDQIYKRNHIPILVGGTAFYIQALLYGIDFTQEEHDNAYRDELGRIAKTEEGKQNLHHQLQTIDPEYAKTVHYNNAKRVIRALEYHHFTGNKFSEYNASQHEKQAEYDFKYFVLTDDREVLYDRINRRVDQMVSEGLLEEVTNLYQKNIRRDATAMQGVGYREIFEYLDGNCTLEEAIENIKKNTRHFAKRQLTWFRKEADVIWIDKAAYQRNEEKILHDVLAKIKEN